MSEIKVSLPLWRFTLDGIMQEPFKNPVHACFRLDIKFPITVENDGDLLKLWHSLSYRIMRQPDDLLAHTRRIRLCQESALNDRLAGALADLEYVLGERGGALLMRLRAESIRAARINNKLTELYTEGLDDEVLSRGRVLPTMTQLLQRSATTGALQSTS